MPNLFLKPQWSIQADPAGQSVMVVSELRVHTFPVGRSALIRRLVKGVDPDDLSDREFEQVNEMVDMGLVSTVIDESTVPWELEGYQTATVTEQLNHLTVQILDHTRNALGDGIKAALIAAGVKVVEADDHPRLLVLVTDSLGAHIPTNVSIPILPVVANRYRLTVGPLTTDRGVNHLEVASENAAYLKTPRYELTPMYDALQRAWLPAAIFQFISTVSLRYGTIVEFNMTNQEFKQWPVKVA